MYHAESFAKLHFETFFVGYGGKLFGYQDGQSSLTCQSVAGSEPVPSLLGLSHVHFLYLSQPLPSLRKLPFVIFAPIKIAQQIFSVLHALLWCIPHPPEFILVQVGSLVAPRNVGKE